MNKPKKYLVVGGAGFIGSNLTNELVRLKHKVIVLDNLSTGKKESINSKAKFVKEDIRNLNKIRPYFKGVDGVFLLAALPRVQYSIDYPVKTNRNNIEGILNILIASKDAKVRRVVYSSSSSVYGDQDQLPVKESFVLNPLSPYALQKVAGEGYCKLFAQIYGLETVCLRYFNIYGPGMDDKGAYALVIAKFLKLKKQGKPLPITGDGTQTRDFTHVFDAVNANILAMNSKNVGEGEAMNIGAGKNYSVNRIAELIGGDVEHIEPRIEPHDNLADNSLAKKLLNWKPRVSLKEGIRDLMK